MIAAKGFAAFDAKSPLRPWSFERREPGENDVLIDILYCGVCHSDLHTARGEWGGTVYPVVPGHEIVGRVSRAGSKATRFRSGDLVGVGCFVGSCGTCSACKRGLENYCDKAVFTYNAAEPGMKTPTYGGYSTRIVVDEHFVLRVHQTERLDAVAPLLCAGITLWSPLQHWKIGKGHKLAVQGLGGLGHMGVKLAAALGAEVTVLSTSAAKKADALRLGAHDFLVTSNADALRAAGSHFDFILDTVSAPHDLGALANLLVLDGTLILVGASPQPLSFAPFSLIPRRRSIAGSLVGGIPETQAMLDFCAARNITADVETIPVQDVDKAYDRMLKGDVRYRFSLDIASLNNR